MKPAAPVGAESEKLNIVIPPLDFFVRRRSRCRLRRGKLSLSITGLQLLEAHCEITGVVAVGTIHNSVDE
jgi:hypothetical protein